MSKVIRIICIGIGIAILVLGLIVTPFMWHLGIDWREPAAGALLIVAGILSSRKKNGLPKK